LQHSRDLVGALPSGLAGDVAARDDDGTAVYVDVTRHGIQERRFTRAVRTNDGDELTGRNF